VPLMILSKEAAASGGAADFFAGGCDDEQQGCAGKFSHGGSLAGCTGSYGFLWEVGCRCIL